MRCPVCQKPVTEGSRDRPFCSNRCRLIDLDNWLADRYRISSPARESAGPLDAAEATDDDLAKDAIEGDPP